MAASTIKSWIYAARPHTLPLALSGIVLGNALAFHEGFFNFQIALFALLTALLLQILSNFANDYGDFLHGADNEERVGPKRTVQSGAITASAMKKAMIITTILAFCFGLLLLWFAYPQIGLFATLTLLAIGIFSIIAAITYTASNKPYGYIGLGDIAVFLFFGMIGVLGPYFLQSGKVSFHVILPAAAFGLLSTAVLNINNIRDIASDIIAGKKTIPVRIGEDAAKVYQWMLTIIGAILFIVFTLKQFDSNLQYLSLLFLIPVFNVSLKVQRGRTAPELSPCLKQMAITSSVFALALSLALISTPYL